MWAVTLSQPLRWVLTWAIPLPNSHTPKTGSWLELFLMILYNWDLIDGKSMWSLGRKMYTQKNTKFFNAV